MHSLAQCLKLSTYLFQGNRFGARAYHIPQESDGDPRLDMDTGVSRRDANVCRLFGHPRDGDVTRWRQRHSRDDSAVLHADLITVRSRQRHLYSIRVLPDTPGTNHQSILPTLLIHRTTGTPDEQWSDVIVRVEQPEEDSQDVDHHCCTFFYRLAAILRPPGYSRK